MFNLIADNSILVVTIRLFNIYSQIYITVHAVCMSVCISDVPQTFVNPWRTRTRRQAFRILIDITLYNTISISSIRWLRFSRPGSTELNVDCLKHETSEGGKENIAQTYTHTHTQTYTHTHTHTHTETYTQRERKACTHRSSCKSHKPCFHTDDMTTRGR